MILANQTEVNEVFLLGCGSSVNDLTAEEVAYINRSPCRVAINKFAAFHQVIGIVPTHVWFTEYHVPSDRVLQYTFDVLRKANVHNLTFVMGHRTGRIFTSYPRYLCEHLRKVLHYKVAHHLNARLFPTFDYWNYFYIPGPEKRGWTFQRIRHTHEVDGPLTWAKSFEEPLFHHRTAFTAALNFVSVLYPRAKIRLVGVDFTTHGYFFSEEQKRRRVAFEDYTSKLQKERNRHFATIPDAIHKPGTVFGVFPFMRQSIIESGGTITCNNPHSATISEGLADYEPIIPLGIHDQVRGILSRSSLSSCDQDS